MTYRWLTDLGQILEARGIPVKYVDGWQNRGRPPSTGEFNPTGLLCHHTASPKRVRDQSELNVILSGNSEAPGPISQLGIFREFQGVYVIAAGRANHAGRGRAPWLGQGKVDGNACMLGIEVSNDGSGEYWPDWQIDLYARTVAACCQGYNWPLQNVLIHHDFSQPYYPGSKCDPAGPWKMQPNLPGLFKGTWNVGVWRDYVSQHLGQQPQPPTPSQPAPPRPPMEDDVLLPPIMFCANNGQEGTLADGRRFRVGQDGTVFYADGRRIQYRWVTPETATDDAYASGQQGGASQLPGDKVANLAAMGVLIGRIPDKVVIL